MNRFGNCKTVLNIWIYTPSHQSIKYNFLRNHEKNFLIHEKRIPHLKRCTNTMTISWFLTIIIMRCTSGQNIYSQQSNHSLSSTSINTQIWQHLHDGMYKPFTIVRYRNESILPMRSLTSEALSYRHLNDDWSLHVNSSGPRQPSLNIRFLKHPIFSISISTFGPQKWLMIIENKLSKRHVSWLITHHSLLLRPLLDISIRIWL